MVGLISAHTNNWYDSFFAYAGVCTAEVSIYRVSISGQKELPAVAISTVDASAKFKFENLELELDEEYSNYLIEVVGEGGGPCDVVYQRPLMGQFTKQDVDYSSTLLSYTLTADLPRKIHQVKSTDVESLMNVLTGGSIEATFSQLVSDANLRDRFFELFGGNPEKLQYIPPTITSETIPSILNEEVIHLFKFSALHWSASYDIIVKWKLNGEVIQTTPIGTGFSYAPGMNESGAHTLQAFIGKDNGSGELDINYPYQVKSYNILVNNNSLPVIPTFTLPLSITSTNSVVASIQTGAELVNCESFSSFTFTVNDGNTPEPSSVSTPCIDSINQNATISLGSDGIHQIRFWVKDRSNLVIGSNPMTITKDSTNPQTQLVANKSIYSSAEAITLTLSASDNLGLSTLELFKSEDGTNYIKITDLNFSDSSYSLAAPSSTINNFKIKLKATDNAGLISESILTLSIDADAPSAPIISLFSATPTNSISTQLTVASCTDVHKILVKESSTTPSSTDPSWQNCSNSLGSTMHTLSLGDGVKNLYAFAKDAAGNVSYVSNSVSLTLDQTAPIVPNLATYPYGSFNSNNIQYTVPSCTDVSHLLISESPTTPILTNPTWQACSTVNGAIAHTFSSDSEGEFTLYAWAKDSVGNISATRSFSIIIDKTAPILSSLKINDDDEYTGTSFVSLKVGVIDNLSPIQVHFAEANATTGDCASEYASNDEWYNWTSATQEFSFALSSLDGVKKVCVWARDAANNIAATSMIDDIQYFVANPPKIISLNVYNPADNSRTYTTGNNSLNIDWSISSTLDLPTNPISIAYTTDGTLYKDVITNQDVSDPTNMTWVGAIGSGLKSVSGNYTSFAAPTSFFRIKLFVKDVSGNIGIPVISNIQNSGNWSIYAGTEDRGVGGAGKSAILRAGLAQVTLIAIHPTTNDIYAFDNGLGIKKLDARTGIVSLFIASHSTNNLLSNNGILPSSPKAPLSSPVMHFDKNGLLYLSNYGYEFSAQLNQLSIYQINPVTREVKLYLSGGSDIGSADTLPSISQMNIAKFIGIDDENSLYIAQNCSPGNVINVEVGHRNYKLVKVTQNNLTKNAQEVVKVAGNCSTPGIPANGSLALESPLPPMNYLQYLNGIAWEGGKNLYVFWTGAAPYKVIDGKFYTADTLTDVVSGVYQVSTGKVFASRSGLGIVEITPQLEAANGDIVSTLSGASSDGCSEDDISVSSACPRAFSPPVQNGQGKIFFTDGVTSTYRVRYISNDNKIKTIFGTKALYGEGLEANLARGQFAGIYYKKSSEPNQASFPEGLYFAEATAPAFGFINPSTKLTSIIWGDQSFRPNSPNGSIVSNQSSMGTSYGHINGQILTFDPNGLPWVGVNRILFSLDNDFRITQQTSTTNRYENRADDTLITNMSLNVEGFQSNLQFSSSGLAFMLGSYHHSAATMRPVLKALNFGMTQNGEILAGSLKHLMGNTSTAGTSVDSSAPITGLSISSQCQDGICKTFYDEINNRLYFSEETKIRYIDNPNTPSIATLGTLVDTARSIGNFTFSPDMSTLYYIDRNNLKFFCINITSARAECVANNILGPPTGAAGLNRGPNQFAWKDSSTLLISNYNGVIYEYKVP